MEIISSTIHLGQIKTAITRTSRKIFSFLNHLIKPPLKTKKLNWKVHNLLMWMEFIFPLIWILDIDISID